MRIPLEVQEKVVKSKANGKKTVYQTFNSSESRYWFNLVPSTWPTSQWPTRSCRTSFCNAPTETKSSWQGGRLSVSLMTIRAHWILCNCVSFFLPALKAPVYELPLFVFLRQKSLWVEGCIPTRGNSSMPWNRRQ